MSEERWLYDVKEEEKKRRAEALRAAAAAAAAAPKVSLLQIQVRSICGDEAKRLDSNALLIL